MDNSRIDWDFILEQLSVGKFVPVISDNLIRKSLFTSDDVLQAWAQNERYPFSDSDNLTRVSQYSSIIRNGAPRAKSNYLHFLKQQLLKSIEDSTDANPDFLRQVGREIRSLSFSQLASERLQIPDFSQESSHPLSILAGLDIPIYITTSHHHFLQAALRANHKDPRTEVYIWQEGIEDDLREYISDPDFDPTVQTPLVYHLHGIDDFPSSLVLTEDDYLAFLVQITQDFNTDAFPTSVRNALNTSLLILLGYALHSWDLRVLLQGVLKGEKPLRPRSFTIQVRPENGSGVKDMEQFQIYLREYFGHAKFDVYWGNSKEFMNSLMEKYLKY